MSTISNTITHGITLATTGTYASPLTIASVGYVVDNSGTEDAVYGPGTQGWTVINQGRLTSSGGSGIDLRAGGLVDNSGTVVSTSQIGVYITGAAGTVVNAGTIIGGATAGVRLFSGLVANQAGGLINASSGSGVSIVGGAGTVTNLGSISGPSHVGVALFAGGQVINGSSTATGATISGHQAGVELVSSPAQIVNHGVITGVVGGMQAFAGATVSNFGLISGGFFGADFLTVPATITNAGTIVTTGSSGPGLRLAGGTIDNTGTIAASGVAILLSGTTQINNSGTIAGRFGISTYSTAGVTVTNFGVITGTGPAFERGIAAGSASQVTNYGTISATGSAGTGVQIGGSLLNAAGGLITGPRYGVNGFGTVINSGTIAASPTLSGTAGTGVLINGFLSNAVGGLITGPRYGVSGVGTLVNSGTIASSPTLGSNAIRLQGTVFNEAGGLIRVKGVYLVQSAGHMTNAGTIIGYGVGASLAAGGTVVNSGTVLVSNGVLVDAAGLVINQAGGTIIGGDGYGISITGLGSVSNAGYVIGGSHSGVGLNGGGIVTNQAGGTIVGNFIGVKFALQAGTLRNAGVVRGLGGHGVQLGAGGRVVNQAGGSIISDNPNIFGVLVGFGPSYVKNAGYMEGIFLRDNGTLVNQSGGAIGGMGVHTANFGPTTAANAGFIGGYGLTLSAGGSVTNDAGGTIVATDGTFFTAVAGVYIQGGAGTVSNAGTIVGASSGVAVKFGGSFTNRLIVQAGAVFGGTLTGGDGTDTFELAGSASAPVIADYNALALAGFEQVLFGTGNYATLKVSNNSGTLPVTISGFDATTETIDLTGIGGDGQVTNHDTVNHRVTVTGSLGSVTLQLDASDGPVFVTTPDGSGGTNFTIACFCRGTLIRTPSGEVPVEGLAIGDRVVTLSGRARPIKWIGRRAYDPRFVRGNRNILPVRVLAGALGAGVPGRDLCLSPEHALYVDGLLLPARHLINGATIRQAGWDGDIEYFHIELDSHDVILAEGAAAESFVAFGGRGMFHNGGEFGALYPGDQAPDWQPYETLLHRGMAGLARVRARLLARAARLGLTSRDPDLHLVADGAVIRPQAAVGGVHRFAITAGARSVRIASRRAIPAETEASSTDRRRLGVAVRRILLQRAGRRLEIGPDCHALRDGFHADEGSHRWTDGNAVLPPELLAGFSGDFAIEVQLAASELHYPITRYGFPARAISTWRTEPALADAVVAPGACALMNSQPVGRS